jgi:hypothetical protein
MPEGVSSKTGQGAPNDNSPWLPRLFRIRPDLSLGKRYFFFFFGGSGGAEWSIPSKSAR